jgi:hypothetical protein
MLSSKCKMEPTVLNIINYTLGRVGNHDPTLLIMKRWRLHVGVDWQENLCGALFCLHNTYYKVTIIEIFMRDSFFGL